MYVSCIIDSGSSSDIGTDFILPCDSASVSLHCHETAVPADILERNDDFSLRADSYAALILFAVLDFICPGRLARAACRIQGVGSLYADDCHRIA